MPKNRKRQNLRRSGGAPSRRGRERRLSVRSELRSEPDVRKLARAVIALAMAQAEADAAAEAARGDKSSEVDSIELGPDGVSANG